MTEKRFKLEKKIFDGYCIVDTMEEGYCAYDKQDLEKHCEKINTLFDEHERLRKDCTILVHSNQEYRKENEQLKATIKEVTELLSDEVDLFSDKATEHDINAYMELKEFDNKDAFYMATATKKAIKMLKELIE